MHLKSFTFGMGTGLIILSLIFFITLNLVGLNSEPTSYSEYEIIEIAEQLGMVFPQDEDSSSLEIYIDNDNLEELDEIVYSTEVTLFITYGTPAIDIAKMLYSENIIDDEYGFNEYLIRTGFSNRLRSGSLTFKTNSSFEEATSVLIGRDLFPHELQL